jgi:hypothetical protein
VTLGSKQANPGRKLLWLALLLGVLCGFENHYQALRLVELTVTPPGSLPDPVLWRSIGSLSRRFWVIPVLRREAIARELGERYPAGITVSISGWGRIGISVQPRAPWLEMVYQGQDYVLSTDGYIWPKSFSIGTKIEKTGGQAPLPRWQWDKNLQGLFTDTNRRDTIVQKANLPMEDLRRWQEKLSRQGWLGKPIFVTVSIRGGARFLKVVAQRNNQRIQLELGDHTENWETIFSATRKILAERAQAEEPSLIIDATYEGKIVASNVPPDGMDGKRRRPEGSETN